MSSNAVQQQKRKHDDATMSLTTTNCKDCHQVKAKVSDCAWDNSHRVCSDCAACCSYCGQGYCEDCRIVLVLCDSCDAMFCPTCKPRVCVCIIPRMATCFMMNFKFKSNENRKISASITEGTTSREASEGSNIEYNIDKEKDVDMYLLK